MRTALNDARGYQAAVLAALAAVWLAASAPAAELMPPAQQNALVRKYCAVCHTDAVMNGGLSLEHFDAAQAAPSLTAMMLSKLTGGMSLEMVKEAGVNPSAAALLNKKMSSGAMGAAGIPIPDKATIDALVNSFAVESAGATEWAVDRTRDGTAKAPGLTASTLREIPSTRNVSDARAYRLTLSCNPAAHEGFMQLAWSPIPHSGTLAASADGKVAIRYPVEGSEKMGNRSGVVTSGLAALVLAETKRDRTGTGLPLPAESLIISDLFEGEKVVFSFANLPTPVRHEFDACFPDANASDR
jgi:hypothetical protein